MASLPKSKQAKLGFVFCKAVCLGRIHEIRRLNEKRKNEKVKENLKQMALLEKRLIKEYKDKARLMGLEGNIAKLFFYCIRELLPGSIGFSERGRFSGDIYNSLLNSAHSILRTGIQQRLVAKGLNPAFGFLHFEKEKPKPFLAWDFSEFWIPYVDKLCFYAANKRIFSEKDFVNSGNGNGQRWLNGSGWKKLRVLMERFDWKLVELKLDEFCGYLDGSVKRFKWTT